jgi:hypothetical protein
MAAFVAHFQERVRAARQPRRMGQHLLGAREVTRNWLKARTTMPSHRVSSKARSADRRLVLAISSIGPPATW